MSLPKSLAHGVARSALPFPAPNTPPTPLFASRRCWRRVRARCSRFFGASKLFFFTGDEALSKTAEQQHGAHKKGWSKAVST